DREASDLYLTAGAAPSLRIHDVVHPLSTEKLSNQDVLCFLRQIISEENIAEFESTLEYNTAINWKGKARFRINVFRQQQQAGIVLRLIRAEIPTLAELELPPLYGDLVMEKRGLILLVGPTGSGKSTSLASMLEHRNIHGAGHIVTIEDPVEFIHEPRNC